MEPFLNVNSITALSFSMLSSPKGEFHEIFANMYFQAMRTILQAALQGPNNYYPGPFYKETETIKNSTINESRWLPDTRSFCQSHF